MNLYKKSTVWYCEQCLPKSIPIRWRCLSSKSLTTQGGGKTRPGNSNRDVWYVLEVPIREKRGNHRFSYQLHSKQCAAENWISTWVSCSRPRREWLLENSASSSYGQTPSRLTIKKGLHSCDVGFDLFRQWLHFPGYTISQVCIIQQDNQKKRAEFIYRKLWIYSYF